MRILRAPAASSMELGLRHRIGHFAQRTCLVQRRLEEGASAVALTFDDGPDPVYTPRVLDTLADHGAVATFFLLGQSASRHEGLVRRMVREGHGIGSHSWSHPPPWSTNWSALLADYRMGRRAVEQAAGRRCALFRPPRGEIDGRGSVVMRALGLRPWLWSVDPEDWRPGIGAHKIVTGARAAAAGDVVLLHDGLAGSESARGHDRSATVEALAEIIAVVRGKGLALTTLPVP